MSDTDRIAELERDLNHQTRERVRQWERANALERDLARQKEYTQGYYNEASEGWTKFRDCERKLIEAEAKCARLESQIVEYEVALGGPKYRPAEPTNAGAAQMPETARLGASGSNADAPAPTKFKHAASAPAHTRTEAGIPATEQNQLVNQQAEATAMPPEPNPADYINVIGGMNAYNADLVKYRKELRRHCEALTQNNADLRRKNEIMHCNLSLATDADKLAELERKMKDFARLVILGQQPCDYGKWHATESRLRAEAETVLAALAADAGSARPAPKGGWEGK